MAEARYEFAVVTTTSDRRDSLEQIAEVLIERDLAACVQVGGPVTSTFRWQGKTETSDEWTATIKTTTALVDEVMAAVRSRHHYDVPEIIVTPIVGGDRAYLDWIRDSTRSQ